MVKNPGKMTIRINENCAENHETEIVLSREGARLLAQNILSALEETL